MAVKKNRKNECDLDHILRTRINNSMNSATDLLQNYYKWIDDHPHLPEFMKKEIKQMAEANHNALMISIGAVELTHKRTIQDAKV